MGIRQRFLCMLVLLSSAWVAPAGAQEATTGHLRHTVLIDEFVNDEQQDSSAAESKLMEDLLAQGVIFIDEAQARKIRSVTDAGTLLDGKISEVITSLDADIIIAGKSKINMVAGRKVGNTTLTRCDTDLQLKIISVDTGEVIGAFTVRGEALGLNGRQAAQDSAHKAAAAAAPKVMDAVTAKASGPSRIEVLITGTTNVTATERVRAALAEVPGVASVKVLQAGRAMTKMAAQVAGVDARALALKLQEVPDVGLEVWGYTNSAVKAEYSHAAALDMPLVTLPFVDKDNNKAYRWVAASLADVFAIELANCEFLDSLEGSSSSKAKTDAASLRAMAKKMDLDPGKTLVVTGSYSYAQDKVRFEARIISANSGKVVLTGQDACKPEELSECAIKVAGEMADKLLDTIVKKRQLFGKALSKKQVKMAAASSAAPGKPLTVVSAKLDNLFPSRLGSYSDQPVGTVTLGNQGDEPIEGLVVSAQLLGFMKAPLDHQFGMVPAGENVEVPLKVVLDRDALAGLDENRPAMMTVKYSYKVGNFQLEQTSSHSVMVYDRNSITWADPGSVATFVNPASSQLKQLLSATTGGEAEAELRRHPLYRPVQLHRLISELKIEYRADAVNPYGKESLDYVQYPEETVAARAGDCDDLAVLYASLLEGAGVPAAILLTPGHVLVAVDTGLPAQLAQRITAEPKHVLLRNGTVWVPVETTLVGSTFADAWQRGAEELASWESAADKVTVVGIREAWPSNPPVSLANLDKDELVGVEGIELGPGLATELGELDKVRAEAVQALLAKLEAQRGQPGASADLANRMGVILAIEGNLERASSLFAEAARNKPNSTAYNNLGNVAVVQNNLAEGLKSYGKALELDPENVDVHLNSAILNFMEENYDEALEHFIECIELGAEDRVATLGSLGIGPGGGGSKGASADKQAGRGLAELARDAFGRSKKKLPESMSKEGGTKASDAAGKVELHQYLYWL